MEETHGRRSQDDLDDLAFEVARLHHEQGYSAAKIFEEFVLGEDIRSKRDVRFLMNRAKDLCNVKVTRKLPRVSEDESLSEELTEVAGLDVIVAKTGELASEYDQRGSHDELAGVLREQRDLHQRLGVVAARHIWRRLRDGDTLGLGPGTGVWFTVEALAVHAATRPKAHSSLTVVSLTGGAAGPHFRLNADAVTQRMADVLGADDRLVQLPIFVNEPKDAVIRAANAGFLLESDTERPVSMAVYGARVVDHCHYLFRRTTSPLLVDDDLAELSRIIETCPTAVIDVCHYFWPGLLAPELADSTRSIISRLNSKVVTITPAVLRSAEQRILVAGGAQKYVAIYRCLADPDLKPTKLVTDEATARCLREDLKKKSSAIGHRVR